MGSPGHPLFHVDAFTDKPFAGNPAAVCLLPAGRWPADAWMQSVGAEMNLSETAFVKPAGGPFDLRWFTPTKEVDLCGHATLAASHVLWEEGVLKATQEAAFETRSGRLTCRRDGASITMDFPAEPAQPCPAPQGLLGALGVGTVAILRSRLDYLAVLPNPATLRAAKPLTKAPELQDQVRGFILTAPGDRPGIDYICRYFAPAFGIEEDPVTGSIQCTLGPYWAERLGKSDLTMWQASRRGGTMRVRPQGNRVLLTGQALTTARGHLVA
jgi:PhzF family phenazine biosynthesis protein